MTGRHSSFSVRGMLVGAAVALLLFVVVSVWGLTRLVPQAHSLDQRGAGLTTVTIAVRVFDSTLVRSADDLEQLRAEVARSGRPPDRPTAERMRDQLRLLADSTWDAQAGRTLGPIPDSARITLARAIMAESDAVMRLVDAEGSLALADAPAAAGYLRDADRLRREAHRYLDQLAEEIVRDLAGREASYARASDRTVRFTTWWAIVGLLLVGGLSLLAYERLYRPLGALERGLAQIAAGNLQHRVPVRHDDELGRLQRHLNTVADGLHVRAREHARQEQNLVQRLGRMLEEGSNEIYIVEASTWRLLVTNRRAQRNLGYTEGQLAEMTPLDLLPDFTHERFEAVLETVRSGVQPRAFLMTKLRRADGSTYPVEVTIRFSEAEDPPVFHIVVQDVSERTRIEAERDLVFQHSADLMAIGDLETKRLLRVNPACAAALGLSETDVTARSFLDLMHEDDQALVRRQLERLAAGVPIRGTAVRMRGAGGEYRWISWNIQPARDGLIYPIGRDITDRRRAETRQAELQAAVARSAREWRITFDALDDPIVIVNQAGEIVRVNEAARRLAGQTHSDVLEQRLQVLEPRSLWGQSAALVAQVRASHQPVSSQVRAGREPRTWDLTVHPVSEPHAGPMAAIIIAHDVTPVIRLQDSARRNEAMAAMGSLVAGVAHEVRNPLFSMTATLDAFEARAGAAQAGQRHIGVLRTQLERLQQLMRELLEYGKPPRLAIEQVSLARVVGQAMDESAVIADAHDVELVADLPAELPELRADPARLTQVYVNLLTNAVHHAPRQSRVVILAQAVSENGSRWVETVVEDFGRGFPPEDLPRIFEPFFSRRAGGTGLGLALVRRIVEQHGGSVSVGNRPEGGAAVMVRLPIGDDAALRPSDAAPRMAAVEVDGA